MYRTPLRLSLFITCLLVLSGCQNEYNAKKEPTVSEVSSQVHGEVLFSIDGKPKITVDDFERYKDQFFKIQPQYKQILQFMPKTEQIRIDQNIFQNMVSEILFQEWVEKNQIDKRKDYQEDYAMIMEMGKRNLAIKFYQEENPVKLSDDEIKKFYEDNKDKMQELMKSPGGVNAKAVKFEDEATAKDFLAQVKQVGNLEKAAQEAGHPIEDLEEVNQMSFNVDTPVRQKLLELKNFPAHLHVKVGDKSHYVVHAISKDKPEYVPFEQVKPGLENFLKQQKMSDMLTKAAEKLQQKYGGVENTKFFTQKMVEAEKAEKERQDKSDKNVEQEPETDEFSMEELSQSTVKGA